MGERARLLAFCVPMGNTLPPRTPKTSSKKDEQGSAHFRNVASTGAPLFVALLGSERGGSNRSRKGLQAKLLQAKLQALDVLSIGQKKETWSRTPSLSFFVIYSKSQYRRKLEQNYS